MIDLSILLSSYITARNTVGAKRRQLGIAPATFNEFNELLKSYGRQLSETLDANNLTIAQWEALSELVNVRLNEVRIIK